MPRKYVRTIDDYPDTEILIEKFNAHWVEQPRIITDFVVGRSGKHYHFSRRVRDHLWASWNPTITQVKLLIHAVSCPKEDLPRMAVQKSDYNVVHLKFTGPIKVPTAGTIARDIAIARLEGKLS